MPEVVLPALNEAEAIPWVLARMPAGYQAIVVDNGSTDDTAAVAAAGGAQVVPEPQRGFGAACWRGLQAASADVVCFMDADASFDPGDLPSVVGPVEAGTADLVLGARQPERGAWPVHARLANRALAFELRRRSGLAVRDLGPMRAARREDLLRLGIEDRRSGWPLEMVLRAAAAGWRVREVPVTYRPRSGRSKVTGTVRGTVRAVTDMSAVLASVGGGVRSASGGGR
jgi:glycosyltransferase involved in cell wall biosynthesis